MDSFLEQSSLFIETGAGFIYKSKNKPKSRQNAGRICSNKNSRSKYKQSFGLQHTQPIMTSEFTSIASSICDFKYELNRQGQEQENKRIRRVGGIKRNSISKNKNKENEQTDQIRKSTIFLNKQLKKSYLNETISSSKVQTQNSQQLSKIRRSIAFDENYENKIKIYQQNKAKFIKENYGSEWALREINQHKNIQRKIQQNLNKSSLLQKMKNTLKISKQIKCAQQLDNQEDQQIQKFRGCLIRQIQIQNQFRVIKAQLSHTNKTSILNQIRKNKKHNYHDYDIQKIISIDFGEYDPADFLTGKSSFQGQQLKQLISNLIQKYQQSNQWWKSQISKKHSKTAVQRLLYGNKQEYMRPRNIQITLQQFETILKQFLLKDIRKKQIYRIFNRVKPMTRSNILYTFCS